MSAKRNPRFENSDGKASCASVRESVFDRGTCAFRLAHWDWEIRWAFIIWTARGSWPVEEAERSCGWGSSLIYMVSAISCHTLRSAELRLRTQRLFLISIKIVAFLLVLSICIGWKIQVRGRKVLRLGIPSWHPVTALYKMRLYWWLPLADFFYRNHTIDHRPVPVPMPVAIMDCRKSRL